MKKPVREKKKLHPQSREQRFSVTFVRLDGHNGLGTPETYHDYTLEEAKNEATDWIDNVIDPTPESGEYARLKDWNLSQPITFKSDDGPSLTLTPQEVTLTKKKQPAGPPKKSGSLHGPGVRIEERRRNKGARQARASQALPAEEETIYTSPALDKLYISGHSDELKKWQRHIMVTLFKTAQLALWTGVSQQEIENLVHTALCSAQIPDAF